MRIRHFLFAIFLFFVPAITLVEDATAFPADYDGDGISDLVIYRPNDFFVNPFWYSAFYLRPSSGVCPFPFQNSGPGCRYPWGLPGDIPITGNFDGIDNRADLAVFRPGDRYWYILFSNGGGSVQVPPTGAGSTGMLPGDLPDETDWNNDGRSDIVYYRPSSKQYCVRVYDGITIQVACYNRGASATGELDPTRPISHNYTSGNPAGSAPGGELAAQLYTTAPDCGGTTLSQYRSRYHWTAFGGSFGGSICIYNVNPNDITVVGNYGGVSVNLADYVRWIPGPGWWMIHYNNGGVVAGSPVVIPFGLNGDVPIGFVKSSTGISWPAVYRPNEGNWYINNLDSQTGCPGVPGYLTNPAPSVCVQQWGGLGGDIPVY